MGMVVTVDQGASQDKFEVAILLCFGFRVRVMRHGSCKIIPVLWPSDNTTVLYRVDILPMRDLS